MLDWLFSPFADYAFMRKALAGCVCLVLGGAPLGVFLIQRRLSLAGEAIAHSILPGVAIGYLIGGLSLLWMTAGGLIAGLTVAAVSSVAATNRNLPLDASMVVFYLGSLALGVLIISASGTNIDLLGILFGSVLAVSDQSVILVATVATITMAAIAIFYRLLVLDGFDPSTVRRAGPVALLVGPGFLVLVAANLVSGFQALGTLMSLTLMILPAASARFFSPTIPGQIAWAIGLGVLASVTGLMLSFHQDAAAGPAITLVLTLLFLGSLILGPNESVLARTLSRRRPHFR
jgi:zinc/manganese transport system permease protein